MWVLAESNLMGVAAGIDHRPRRLRGSFAMFAAGRAFEQVRNPSATRISTLRSGATHAGISVGEDGPTHQCCEDIAPHARHSRHDRRIVPADDVEARAP